MSGKVESVVIVGGGTAGWIAAASLGKLLGDAVSVTVVESDAIGTVGVGEATIPQIRRLNGLLGLDEAEFVRATQGTFKLGIEFNGWGERGESYLHTFGDPGLDLSHTAFHHYWLRARAEGSNAGLWDYSLHHRAAYAHKFAPVEKVGGTAMTGLAYAYHFDAGLYAKHLRKAAEGNGVLRREGRVVGVGRNAESGFVSHVEMEGGERIGGDLFIDCTGFRGLLIGEAMGVGYRDWSAYLPVDRAVALGCERVEPLLPYTRASAREAGWQWRIPLQHRTGNGYVYCSRFSTAERAEEVLRGNLDGEPTGEAKHLSFTTGRREVFWEGNVVALGLAGGFLEPLESTSIHFVQAHVSRLVELFPTREMGAANRAEFNRVTGKEYELVRDFLVLHYALSRRADTPFWQFCRDELEVPDSLRHKMELFREAAHTFREPDDLFRPSSWVQVMVGQGLVPDGYHRMADRLSEEQLARFLSDVDAIIGRTVEPLPTHDAFIRRHARADAPAA